MIDTFKHLRLSHLTVLLSLASILPVLLASASEPASEPAVSNPRNVESLSAAAVEHDLHGIAEKLLNRFGTKGCLSAALTIVDLPKDDSPILMSEIFALAASQSKEFELLELFGALELSCKFGNALAMLSVAQEIKKMTGKSWFRPKVNLMKAEDTVRCQAVLNTANAKKDPLLTYYLKKASKQATSSDIDSAVQEFSSMYSLPNERYEAISDSLKAKLKANHPPAKTVNALLMMGTAANLPTDPIELSSFIIHPERRLALDKEEYTVEIVTGTRFGAETTSAVSITLMGKDAQTATRKLTSWWQPITYTSGSKNSHKFIDNQIDEIHAIQIDTSHGVVDGSWFVRSVTVRTRAHKASYHFPVFSWIDNGSSRIFFCGPSILPNDPSLPSKIRVLRSKDLHYWKTQYSEHNYVRNNGKLPTGMASSRKQLPMNEKFDSTKFIGFTEAVVEGIIEAKLTAFQNVFKSWKSFDVMKKELYHVLPRPDIIDSWDTDETFGRQFLDGVNPVTIQLCQGKFPAGLNVDSEFLKENVARFANVDVDAALREGKFAYVDYTEHLGWLVERQTKERRENGVTPKTMYMSAPIALLYFEEVAPPLNRSEVVPVAIQLKPEGKVYTKPVPGSTEHEQNEWLLAKMWVNNADTQVHQADVHLLRTHLISEPFAMATHRCLSRSHPIYHLLKPHLKYTGYINTLARESLIKTIGEIFSIGHALLEAAERAYGHWSLLKNTPIADLEARGFGTAETGFKSPFKDMPGVYPWREDALKLFKVVHDYVSEIVNIYYKDNALVQNDEELQSWRAEILSLHPGRPFPPLINQQSLIEVCAAIIWTTSFQHASVNFNQFDYYGWQPNRPVQMRKPIPEEQGDLAVFDEVNLVNTLPDMAVTTNALSLAFTLSRYADNEIYIGTWEDDFLIDDEPGMHARKHFSDALNKVSKELEDNNALNRPGDKSYPWLFPFEVPNSIAI